MFLDIFIYAGGKMHFNTMYLSGPLSLRHYMHSIP